MANGNDSEQRSVPYLPATTFKSFIQQFKNGVVPPRIDRSLMTTLSGADQSMLRIALRFFRLVDAERNDAVTDRFRTLVEAIGTEAWKPTLRALVDESYSDIVAGLDKAATSAQLDEHFRARASVSGSVLDKAVRFYLTLAEEAGIELSPHFKKRTSSARRAGGGKVKRVQRDDQDNSTQKPPLAADATTKTLRFTVPSGEVQVIVPAGITKKEIGKLGGYIKDYFDLLNGSDD